MNTELLPIPKETALQVFTTAGGIDPYLAAIRVEIDAFVPDLKTKKGREAIAAMAYKVAKSKTYLEDVGKTLADEAKDVPKKIDAARKKVRKPLTDWEAAEDRRVADIKGKIDRMVSAPASLSGMGSDAIGTILAELNDYKPTEADFGEYLPAAVAAHNVAVSAVDRLHKEALQRELDAAELAKLRQQAAERAAKDKVEADAKAAKDRDERIAAEAAEKARIEAETKAQREAEAVERKAQEALQAAAKREADQKEAIARAEREKAAADERALKAEQEAREKAARDHAAKLAAEALAAAAREENTRHRAKINRAALKALVDGGIAEDVAKLVIELIAKKTVPAVTINY